jgi:S-ribosylhomocysteine lyase
MKDISSFAIDHKQLKRGIFVSRKDRLGNETITTFDIRIKEPNREPAIDMPILHTIEHVGAVFLRNHEIFGQKIIYFGPMGCRTGFYLLFGEDLESKKILPLVLQMFVYIAQFEGDVPGATPESCGNFLSHDLSMARFESTKFLTEVLENVTDENLFYPEKPS